VTRGVKIAIWDKGSVKDAARRAAWLLWRQTLIRAYLQPNYLATVQKTVPECYDYKLSFEPIIKAVDKKYQSMRSAFRLIYFCNEYGT